MFPANYNIDLFDSFANELQSECHIWMNFYKCDPNQNTSNWEHHQIPYTSP